MTNDNLHSLYNPNDASLTHAELGILDVLITMCRVFESLNISSQALVQLLEVQREGHRKAGRTNASVAIGIVIDYLTDPMRLSDQKNLNILYEAPPEGTS